MSDLVRTEDGLWIRPGEDGEQDKMVARVNIFRGYPTKPDDVVLDVGAFIGTFAMNVAPNVKKVIAFEAGEDNARVLRANLDDLPNCEAIWAAVVDGPEEFIDLWHGKFGPVHSTVKVVGRKPLSRVPAVSLDKAIETYRPTSMKFNIERAEYGLSALRRLPDHVTTLGVELHSIKTKTYGPQAAELEQAVLDQGFKLVLTRHSGLWRQNRIIVGQR